jgi:nucleotide-binding universal stress UspA family protein
MIPRKKRRSFEEGHLRKMLVVVDDSQEVEAALFFCASRIAHSSGAIVMLHVIEPQDFSTWMGVQQLHIEEETNKAKARFRLYRRKLNQAGYENVVTEEVVREGKLVEEIVKLIEEDEDIGIFVLGAAVDAKGPGPLVSSLAAGTRAGTFPIPITIVPGGLSQDELQALA